MSDDKSLDDLLNELTPNSIEELEISFLGIYDSEKEYRSDESAINQSLLKGITQNPYLFYKNRKNEVPPFESSGFFMGTLVDTYLFSPDEFEETYACIPEGMSKPISSNEEKFVGLILDGQSYVDAYSGSFSIKGQSPKQIEEKAKERYVSLLDYIKFANSSKDKIQYSNEDAERLNSIYKSIQLHPIARKLLLKEEVGDSNLEFYPQLPVKFMVNNVVCKALLDMVVIDHDNKIIYNIDYKTTSWGISNFATGSYFKYGYDYQQAFYRFSLYAYMQSREDIKDYKIETRCIASQTKTLFQTKVFEISDSTLANAEKMVIMDLSTYRDYEKKGFYEEDWLFTESEINNNYMIQI